MEYSTIYDYFSFFIIYSFLGWCVEVIYQTFKEGRFINRGFLHGPVCPIYGFGVLLVIHFLEPLKSNFIILFFGSLVFTTLLELCTGFVLEKLFLIRWWDYSNNKFNLNGYICLSFSLIWAFACVFVVNIIHPLINLFVDIIPYDAGIIIMFVIFALMLVDLVLTVNAILKFKAKLKRLSQIGEKLTILSDSIGKKLSDETLEFMDKSEKLKEDMYLEKLAIKELKDEKKDIIENHLMKFRYYEYFKFHPKIKFQKYNDVFEEFVERRKKRKR